MRIVIGADHAGYEYKCFLKDFFIEKGYQVTDFGTYSKESVDYPDYIHPVASFIEEGKSDLGVILCGSGNGAAITANKYKKVRAALIWNKQIAYLAKSHNNANIISIPAHFIEKDLLLDMISTFLEAKFEKGRHQIRINKISK